MQASEEFGSVDEEGIAVRPTYLLYVYEGEPYHEV